MSATGRKNSSIVLAGLVPAIHAAQLPQSSKVRGGGTTWIGQEPGQDGESMIAASSVL
jgi:hypothetical protein